jgi:hypothetical protein
MAENTKIILRVPELYGTSRDYKVRAGLADGPLFPSLLESEKIDSNRIVSITYEGQSKSVSEINNQALFDSINQSRSGSLTYTSVLEEEDITLEYIPEHLPMNETIANLERMANEYPAKLSAISYLVSGLFDVDYATGISSFGRGTQVFPSEEGTISSTEELRLSGYIIAETDDDGVVMNLIIRGVPVPMRKTKSSEGVYYFTYPQYLVNNQDSVNSVQKIEVSDSGTNPKYYFGSSYPFVKVGTDPYVNLQIFNKSGRNEY